MKRGEVETLLVGRNIASRREFGAATENAGLEAVFETTKALIAGIALNASTINGKVLLMLVIVYQGV
jgi:hypothetical protein